MKKKAPILTDMALGLVISVFFAWAYVSRSTLIETASLKTYDLFLKHRTPVEKSNVIKIVEIDEESVKSLGRWPWPRSLTAVLLDELVDYGAKVVGFNVLFNEKEQNEGLMELNRLQGEFAKRLQDQKSKNKKKNVDWDAFEGFLKDLKETRENLDGDAILARSMDEAGNIVLPMYFLLGDPQGENMPPLPAFLNKKYVPISDPEIAKLPNARFADVPLEALGGVSLSIGHANIIADQDGVVRGMAPVVQYGNAAYPSFGLQVLREYKSLPLEALIPHPSEKGFTLQSFEIPMDWSGKSLLEFAGPAGTFERYSALDIMSRAITEDNLQDKIVLVGVTVPGLSDLLVGPNGDYFTNLELWANSINNILTQRFIKQPVWAQAFELGVMGLAVVILLLLPLLKARFSVPVTVLIFAALNGASFFLFAKKGLWVTPAYGSLLLASGFIVLTARRLMFTEKGKELVEAESLETNKMLGLSFQGQGMLDLAFEKFQKCPLDHSMKDLLYNLGLDMERKRQFSKAAAVYEHIYTVDPAYKDIKDKIDLLKKAGQGAVFGSVGKKGSEATVVVEGLGQHTTLGRYEVIKELGRGAMGIVYLGKDPKINRQVAIKTLRFEEEVDEEQAKSVKTRFFREAESAGNLTHPNIIRIFDAGEDQDVAYIAMELIEGHDLKKYCDKQNLLGIRNALEYVATVADALSYAHKQGVVHRDIKPGNIMLLKDGTLRITDFGIARIQATSKTATGAVLGTPAYMSPEQVNGNRVDGRADIFSLGVTLFELLTGEKPFVADSIAALLYRISNVDHPDPREYDSKIPEFIVPVLHKALAKDPRQRYQDAAEMALDIKDCLNKLDEQALPSSSAKREPEPLTVTSNDLTIPEVKIEKSAPVPPPDGKPKSPLPSAADLDKTTKTNAFLSELQDALNPAGNSKGKEEQPAPPTFEKTEILTSASDLAEFFAESSILGPKEIGDTPKRTNPMPDQTVLLPSEEDLIKDETTPNKMKLNPDKDDENNLKSA